jgi:hypothetical protein
MDALKSVSKSGADPHQENTIYEIDKVEEEHDISINSHSEQARIITNEKVDKVIENENEGDRVNISISRRAYDALETYTRELNEGEYGSQKAFTIEEVLDEEIILLLSDEGKKD